MNKLVQTIFIILFPFYPIWAWFVYTYTNKPIEFFTSILIVPIALYFVVYKNKKLPRYLIFFILFTVYHISSVFINDTIPKETNKVYFLFSDPNILACLFFILIEYSTFSERFMNRMNKNILIIVIISLIVSIIQIKNPSFFFNTTMDEDLLYVGDNRNFSIYSWTNINSTGITFPILISLMVSLYERKKAELSILVISAVIVSFLTRARYIMLSAIIVLSQIFFNTARSLTKRVSLFVIFLIGIFSIIVVASNFGFDIEEVVNSRILEKDSDMASAKARVLSYDVFMIVFPENPWFGVGPETKKDVIDLLGGEAPLIHVGYLSYLYFYGIVGCAFFFLSLFFLLRYAWIVGRRVNFWGTFYGIVALCFANTTFVYFNLSEMGVVLSLMYLKYYGNYSKRLGDDNESLEEEPVLNNASKSLHNPMATLQLNK